MVEFLYALLASLLWGFAFSGIVNFWYGIFFAASVLVFISFLDGEIFSCFRLKWSHIILGFVSGVLLYGLFYISSILISRYFPSLYEQIQMVESLRNLAPEYVYVPVTLSVSFAEEVFWRGFVLRRLWNRWGWMGFVLAVLYYCAAHITTGNISLLLAAVGAGFFWGLLLVWRRNLLVPIIAHITWDAFLLLFGL